MVSYVQSLIANFVAATKKNSASCFQHLSARFALFWF